MVKMIRFFLCCFVLSACCNSYWESNRFSAFAGVLGDTTVVNNYSVVYYANGKDMELDRGGLNEYPFIRTYQKNFCDVSSAESFCGCPCALSLKGLTVSVWLKDNKNDTLIYLKKIAIPSDGLERISLNTQVSLGRIDGKIPPRKFVHFDYKKSKSMYVESLKDSVYYYTILKGKEDSYVYSDWTEITE